MNVQVIAAVAEAIRDLKEVPNGHLYARVMQYLTLDQYNQILGTLKSAGLIEEANHVLKWTGPAL
jgi:hypothetical protein